MESVNQDSAVAEAAAAADLERQGAAALAGPASGLKPASGRAVRQGPDKINRGAKAITGFWAVTPTKISS